MGDKLLLDFVLFFTSKENKEEAVQATSEGWDVTDVTFVDDFLVEVAVAEARPPSDECETDSEDDFSDREDEDLVPITVCRSGRPIHAQFPPGFVRNMNAYNRHLSKANCRVDKTILISDYFIRANRHRADCKTKSKANY